MSKCDQVEEVTGRNTEWRALSGCYVEVNNRMVPLGSWRGESQ
jgi:hypothetical protein